MVPRHERQRRDCLQKSESRDTETDDQRKERQRRECLRSSQSRDTETDNERTERQRRNCTRSSASRTVTHENRAFMEGEEHELWAISDSTKAKIFTRLSIELSATGLNEGVCAVCDTLILHLTTVFINDELLKVMFERLRNPEPNLSPSGIGAPCPL